MRILTRRSALRASAMLLLSGAGIAACTRTSLPTRRSTVAKNAPINRLKTGATFHGFWNYDSEDEMLIALRTLSNAGGQWARVDVGWAAIETARGVYSEWALQKYDVAIEAARREDLSVLLVFQRTPSWASGSDDPTRAPVDASAFGDFVLKMSWRYAGRISAVEVWNEPNHAAFFTAQKSGLEAREHAQMVKEAYTKLKEQGPQGASAVLVLAGGTSQVDVPWWEELYALGISDFTDAVAVNPYPALADASISDDSSGPSPMGEVDELIELLNREGDSGKPIWFTEFGWSTHWNWAGTETWQRGVNVATQADRFEEAVRLIESNYPQVELALWYNLRDRGGSGHESDFGMLKRNLEPKPVLKRMEELFVG